MNLAHLPPVMVWNKDEVTVYVKLDGISHFSKGTAAQQMKLVKRNMGGKQN